MATRPGLIEAGELGAQLDRVGHGLAIVQVSNEPGRRPRIPGSTWVNLHDGFAQARPDRGLQFDLPSPAEFAATLSRLGVEPATDVVLADDMGNRWSTRVYWLLKYYGHPGGAMVLDGGIAAYLRSGSPVAAEFASPPPGTYPEPSSRDESIRATPAEIIAGMDAGSMAMCDVRSPQEFTGEVEMSGRGGHIPGAVNIPWDACLAEDGTILPDLELATVLEPYLGDPRQPVTYCQGGIRASLAWFALQVLLGRKSKLYAASWEEWAQDTALPVSR